MFGLNSGVAAALGAALLFGASTPLAKLLLGEVAPWLLAGLLYLGSGIGLALLLALSRAERARSLGFSVAEIKELLALRQNKSRSSAAVKKIARAHIDELKRKIAELGSMVDALEHLERHCHGDERPECPILEHLEGA
jgi:hypothetical protein